MSRTEINTGIDIKNETDLQIIALYTLRLLTKGWVEGAEQIYFNKIFFDAHNVKRNPNFLYEFRIQLQKELDNLLGELNELNEKQGALSLDHPKVLYLHNLLSILPFSDPHPSEVYYIPQYDNSAWNHGWRRVPYKLELIELTPSTGVIASYLNDEDRVFSFGLTPISHNTPRFLIHSGTTYPTGQGASVQELTNFFPFFGLGDILHVFGKKNILDWVKNDNRGLPLHVMGQSLGGSLTIYTAEMLESANLTNKENVYYAFNPAGLLWRNSYHAPNQEKILIISQDGDFATERFGGCWPPNALFLKIGLVDPTKLPSAQWPTSPLSYSELQRSLKIATIRFMASHLAMYTGFEGGVKIARSNGETENAKSWQRIRTFLVYHFLRPMMASGTFTMTVLASLGIVINRWKNHQLPTTSFGNVVVPAFGLSYFACQQFPQLASGIVKIFTMSPCMSYRDLLVNSLKFSCSTGLAIMIWKATSQSNTKENGYGSFNWNMIVTFFARLGAMEYVSSLIPKRFVFFSQQSPPAKIHQHRSDLLLKS